MRERYASGISDETAKKMIDLLNLSHPDCHAKDK